jgi:hypothetical protein
MANQQSVVLGNQQTDNFPVDSFAKANKFELQVLPKQTSLCFKFCQGKTTCPLNCLLKQTRFSYAYLPPNNASAYSFAPANRAITPKGAIDEIVLPWQNLQRKLFIDYRARHAKIAFCTEDYPDGCSRT